MRLHGGVRRVPGLRREELAQLAGTAGHVRLEQGRTCNVSENVLEAIARRSARRVRARLSFSDLARPSPARRTPDRPQRSGPLQRVLDTIENAPAFILGRAHGRARPEPARRGAAGELGKPAHSRRNIARFVFANPLRKERFVDWDSTRGSSWAPADGSRTPPDDLWAKASIGELSVKSAEFSRLWSSHDVREKTFGPKQFHHRSSARSTPTKASSRRATQTRPCTSTRSSRARSPNRRCSCSSWIAGGGDGTRHRGQQPVSDTDSRLTTPLRWLR